MNSLLLQTPLGARGSGRVRYGAAMALHAEEVLSEAQLEVYRIAAALDGQDPAAIFAERGVPPPDLPAPAPAVLIRRLVAEADRYLAGLTGSDAPGLAEVRAGLAPWIAGPCMPQGGGDNPVVEAHLVPALVALAGSQPVLAAAIAAGAPHLNWVTYDAYDPAAIGPTFARGHAFAELVGGEAPIVAKDFDLGLFLIAPHVLYRDHAHAAPELYAPLTGPHGWRFGPGTALQIRPAHQPVWNPAHRPHLTKVGPLPFLCLFGWTRDVDQPAYVLPAEDWPALEALRL